MRVECHRPTCELLTLEVEWAYNVKKGNASAYPSTAEAIAKHLNLLVL
jgi:hypothetical protein